MTQKQHQILKHATLASLLLLSSLHANEQTSVNYSMNSEAYLSSLEMKIEEVRRQLQDQQKSSATLEDSLAQIQTLIHEVQALKDKIHTAARDDLLASIDQKANRTYVDHALQEITGQIAKIKQDLELSSSSLQLDKMEKALAQADKDIKQLKLNLQELPRQRTKNAEMEKSFKLLSAQVQEVNQNLRTVEEQQHLLTKKKTPPVQNKGGRIYGEFLYWKNIEPNLNYAIRQTPPSSNATPSSINDLTVAIIGSIKKVEFDWDPGYRIGLGYRWGVNSWDLYAEYTRFCNQGQDSHSRFPIGAVAPFNYLSGMFVESIGSAVYQVNSNATFTYNVGDLVLQRPFYETSSIAMRFLLGLRGTYIKQNWETDYLNPSASFPGVSVVNTWTFGGGGPRTGINFEWIWKYGFGLNFQTSGALIFGHFNNFQSIIEEHVPSTSNYTFALINPKNKKIIPTVEMTLGLQWEKHWGNWGLHFFADWEFNSWFDLNETYYYPFKNYNESTIGSWIKESVSLQGLTLGAGLEF